MGWAASHRGRQHARLHPRSPTGSRGDGDRDVDLARGTDGNSHGDRDGNLDGISDRIGDGATDGDCCPSSHLDARTYGCADCHGEGPGHRGRRRPGEAFGGASAEALKPACMKTGPGLATGPRLFSDTS